jgi:hypothetical protein
VKILSCSQYRVLRRDGVGRVLSNADLFTDAGAIPSLAPPSADADAITAGKRDLATDANPTVMGPVLR